MDTRTLTGWAIPVNDQSEVRKQYVYSAPFTTGQAATILTLSLWRRGGYVLLAPSTSPAHFKSKMQTRMTPKLQLSSKTENCAAFSIIHVPLPLRIGH